MFLQILSYLLVRIQEKFLFNQTSVLQILGNLSFDDSGKNLFRFAGQLLIVFHDFSLYLTLGCSNYPKCRYIKKEPKTEKAEGDDKAAPKKKAAAKKTTKKVVKKAVKKPVKKAVEAEAEGSES